MAAGAMAGSQTTDSGWMKTAWKIFYLLFVVVAAFFIYKYSWSWGTIWLLAGALLFILFLLNPEWRKISLFVFVNLVIATFVGAFIQSQLASNETVVRFIQSNNLLSFLLGGFGESVFWSVVIGLITALLITGIPLLIVAYVGAVYVLALHEVEGVGWWDAMRYMITLILGINLPFMVVENGQALLTKQAGKLGVIGGPGKLITKEGNIVVLERGGKISRVEGAGIVNLKNLEFIRSIFKLGPHTNSDKIEHVLTKDRIPLTITLSMKYYIEPASEVDKRPESRIAPNGEALTRMLDDGLHQVYEGTIRKAALMSQATSFEQRIIEMCEDQICLDVAESTWHKAAGSLPELELRDYIMSYRFDELFELVDSTDGDTPDVRVNRRKIYEIEQAILEQIKPTRMNILGVLIRAVDIGKIVFPDEARHLLLDHWGAPWRQDIGVVEAQGSLEARVLAAQGDQEAKMLEARTDLNVAELEAQAILIKARAEAQRRIMEGHSKAEAQAAFFRFIVEALQIDGRPIDPELTGAILQQLAGTFAAVDDLQNFVRIAGKMNQQSFFIGQSNLAEVNE